MTKARTFDDVLIKPKFSTIRSRKNCNTQNNLGNIIIDLPIISSNMDTITESKMANVMKENGGLGALHRFCSIEHNVKMFLESPKDTFVSIGLGDLELNRAKALADAGASNFIIDVANGASISTVVMYEELIKLLPNLNHVMVGNFATAESILQFNEMLDSRFNVPNSYKVGIGGGSMCTTRIVTGCGMPTFESVLDCAKTGFQIVADGGIRNSGDIAKCLGAGASAVMVGSLLSGTEETSGEISGEICDSNGLSLMESYKINSYVNIQPYKKYRGSASKESYEVQGKTASHRAPEGESTLVQYKGPVSPILQELKAGLQSSMSYVNARNLNEFREYVEFIDVTSNSVLENKAHGKK